jgi:hypothetical protein
MNKDISQVIEDLVGEVAQRADEPVVCSDGAEISALGYLCHESLRVAFALDDSPDGESFEYMLAVLVGNFGYALGPKLQKCAAPERKR